MISDYMKNLARSGEADVFTAHLYITAPQDLFWPSKIYTQAGKYCTHSACHLFVVVPGRASVYLEWFLAHPFFPKTEVEDK